MVGKSTWTGSRSVQVGLRKGPGQAMHLFGAIYADPHCEPLSAEEIMTSKTNTFRDWVMDQAFLMTVG